MKINKVASLCVALLGCSALTALAKVEPRAVYMFGFSASFTDSVAYITPIQQLDSAYMDTKTQFLMDRAVYSDQFQSFLSDTKNMSLPTCAVLFNVKKEKLEKERQKLLKKYGAAQKSVVLKELEAGEFQFINVNYQPPVIVEEQPAAPVKGGKGPEGDKPAMGHPAGGPQGMGVPPSR